MELNKKQIEFLFEFVEEKGVKYYDVQHEIVDHLATSIETVMMSNENTSFDQALHLVYSKFPITGFAQYTVDLEDSLWSFWIRKIFSTTTMGYGIPLIALLVCLSYSIYYTIVANGNMALNILYYGVTALGLLAIFVFSRQFGRTGIELMMYGEFFLYDDDYFNDRLLYYRVLKITTLAMIFVPLFLSRLSYVIIDEQSFIIADGISYSILLLSIFASISIYWSLAVILYFPNMIKEVIAEKYNHVVIS